VTVTLKSPSSPDGGRVPGCEDAQLRCQAVARPALPAAAPPSWTRFAARPDRALALAIHAGPRLTGALTGSGTRIWPRRSLAAVEVAVAPTVSMQGNQAQRRGANEPPVRDYSQPVTLMHEMPGEAGHPSPPGEAMAQCRRCAESAVSQQPRFATAPARDRGRA